MNPDFLLLPMYEVVNLAMVRVADFYDEGDGTPVLDLYFGDCEQPESYFDETAELIWNALVDRSTRPTKRERIT